MQQGMGGAMMSSGASVMGMQMGIQQQSPMMTMENNLALRERELQVQRLQMEVQFMSMQMQQQQMAQGVPSGQMMGMPRPNPVAVPQNQPVPNPAIHGRTMSMLDPSVHGYSNLQRASYAPSIAPSMSQVAPMNHMAPNQMAQMNHMAPNQMASMNQMATMNQANQMNHMPPMTMSGLKPGYTPSIAPSERSTVGLPSRYRPVSSMGPVAGNNGSRTSTMTSNLGPNWAAQHHRLGGSGLRATKRADEDDDDKAWEELEKKRREKKDGWRKKKDMKGIMSFSATPSTPSASTAAT